MKEEYLDIVDMNNKVVGKETKVRIHELNLPHRSCFIYIFNSKNELLLHKRSPNKLVHPDAWTLSAAGHVDSGESYLQTGVRELEEEIGIKLKEKEIKLLGIMTLSEEIPEDELVGVVLGRSDGPFVFDEKEMTDHRFVSLPNLDKMIKENKGQFVVTFLESYFKFRDQIIKEISQ